MGIIILLGILVLVVAGGVVYALTASKENKVIGGLVSAVAAVIGIVIFLFSAFTTVNVSDVGIVTSFGKPVGDLTPGIHLVAPWKNVTVWDDSVQTVSYGRNLDQNAPDHCLEVKIGGLQSACVSVTFQYQVKPGAADILFKKYRTQANMNNSLVVRALDQAINTQLQNFSPIAVATNGGTPSIVPFEQPIINQMIADMGSDIKIDSMFLPYVQFDASTQGRLNAYQTQKVDTLIATEAVATAKQEALAFQILQKQLSSANSASVVAAQCYNNVLVPMVKAGMDPAGIACWPGSGSGSTVVLPKG